jgi:o-succinylbenzoate---CoA ligase
VYDGVPIDGTEVALRPHEAAPAGGLIAVRGPTVMRGYRRRPELTLEVLRDGWLVTPDLGRWRDDGTLEVLGRVDDVIVTGGANVAAGEVAQLLASHPKVAEAAVHGRPDAEWGEVVVAVCVATDPTDPPRLDELRDHVTATAPAYAAPRDLVLVEALPRTTLGKVPRTPAGGPRDAEGAEGLAGPPPEEHP